MGVYISQLKSYNLFNEAYFGKTPGLLEIEKQIHTCRSPYLRKIASPKIYNDKEIQKLEEMLSNEFGFKNLFIEIESGAIPNAYTIPVDVHLTQVAKTGKLVETDNKTGYKFTPYTKAVTLIVITTSIWCDPNITDEEVLAVLLHEIGHNFEMVMSDDIRTFSTACDIFNTLVVFLGNFQGLFYVSNTMYDFTLSVNKYIQRNPVGATMVWTLDSIKNIVQRVFLELTGLLTASTLGIGALSTVINDIIYRITTMDISWFINNIIKGITKKGLTGKENLADYFANIYGYGPAQISVLEKLNKKSKGTILNAAQNIPIMNSITDIFAVPAFAIAGLFDPHPQNVTRAKKMIEDAEWELNNNLNNPRAKKELQAKIKEMKLLQNKYYIEMQQLPEGLIVQRAVIHYLNNKPIEYNHYSDIEKVNQKFKINFK